MPELAYPTRLNCAEELLEGTIARFGPDRPCLRAADGSVWTYEQVRDSANRIARVLTEDLGLVPGNRVLVRGPNNPVLAATWFGYRTLWVNRYQVPFEELGTQPTRTGDSLRDVLTFF